MTEPASAAHVTVRPMTAGEFEVWQESAITSYAAEVAVATGIPVEQAIDRSRAQFPTLLPAGRDTDHTWLMIISDDAGIDVGVLWIGPQSDRPDIAYVYDIAIDEAHRGRGLGRAAMTAAEALVAAAGFTEIGLNVFGFNERARRLYDSLGYRVVATHMTKSLG